MRKCKSKDCNTMLEDDYKSKYCERCLNEKASNTKSVIKIAGGVLASVVLVIGWIFGRKK